MKHANLSAIPALALLSARAYLGRPGNLTSFMKLRTAAWTVSMIVPLLTGWAMSELLVRDGDAFIFRQRDGVRWMAVRVTLTALFPVAAVAVPGIAVAILWALEEWDLVFVILVVTFGVLLVMTTLSTAGAKLTLDSGRGRKGSQKDLKTLRRSLGKGWTLVGLAAAADASASGLILARRTALALPSGSRFYGIAIGPREAAVYKLLGMKPAPGTSDVFSGVTP